MPDLNEEIQKLRTEGRSLREISSAIGISHEAVRKRLKNFEGKGKVSTIETERKLTASTIQNEKVSTARNAHQSRASEEVMDTVNRVSTENTPSLTLNDSVNSPETSSDKPTEGKKQAFPRVLSEVDDLFEAIKVFLEAKEVEVYRMQVEPEAYQVSHNNQVIRFYVQRADGRAT